MVKHWIAIVATVAGLVLVASHAQAADNTAPTGFLSLFNGKDFTGWKVPDGDNGHWKVVDGVIDYDAGSQSKVSKDLWSDREYGDFVLQVDWRLKEAPFINKNVLSILPDGTHAKDIHGKELRFSLPDADSGVFLRGDGFYQANIWCWPIGSGEMYSIRTDKKTSPELRSAVTPLHQADKPVGEWNHFEITVRGKTVQIALNGTTVIAGATIPDLPAYGRIAFQHHGAKNQAGEWTGPPSLVQFKNIYIKELKNDLVKALLITGGHDHETSFYSLFEGYQDLARVQVAGSGTAFQTDLRGKYDVVIMYDFTRDLDEKSKKNLRDFVESGNGVVVLHHALLNYQKWEWWYQDVVGGSYRLQKEGDRLSSTVKNDQSISVTPVGQHPVTAGFAPFHIMDETYKRMWMSPSIVPLLTTDNPYSDPVLAWIGPNPNARVVAIQLGHGHTAHGNPEYRFLVHNAILWAAGKKR